MLKSGNYKIVHELPPPVMDGRFISLDVETYGMTDGKLHRPNGTFACVSILIEGDDTVYQVLEEDWVEKALNMLGGTWVFHNALFDLRQLRRYAEIEPRFIWDTMLVSQSLYGGLYMHHGLKHLVRRDLNELMPKQERENFKTATVMTDEMKIYAAEDVIKTLKLAIGQRDEFEDSPELKTYLTIDEPCIFPILDMPGARIDTVRWEKMLGDFVENAKTLQDELGINVKSPAQVRAFLSDQGVHVKSTARDVLEEIEGDNPTISLILEARRFRDAVSKYGYKWIEKHVELDGYAYAGYNISQAKTGRMSCANPNFQNIPSRHMPEYREMFIASPGHSYLVWDVSQQEIRIMAWESKDTELLRAIDADEDLHLTAARGVFNDPSLTKKDGEKRSIGKAINLGLQYGLTEFGLAKQLNVTVEQAAKFILKYFNRFKGVFNWLGWSQQQAAQKGFVRTAGGRRFFVNTYTKNWKNNAINSPIQGGAADFTKMWVRRVWEACQFAKIPFLLVLIVHDEIVMDVPNDMVEVYTTIIKNAFDETAATLYPGVKFVVEGGQGDNWRVQHGN